MIVIGVVCLSLLALFFLWAVIAWHPTVVDHGHRIEDIESRLTALEQSHDK